MNLPVRTLLLAALLLLAAACDQTDNRPNVSIIDLRIGDGAEVVVGSTVTLHYVGRLTSGTVFDASPPEAPVTFTVGDGEVILGWERGLPGMRVGGRRRLIIPPQLAYGNQAQGCPPECTADPETRENCDQCVIPANSTLLFDIDLLAAQNP